MSDRRLDSLERASPQAARLAELASVAVRVDAGLLRRLRRSLLPDAPPGIEADLWFSAIVEFRSASGFQIAPGLLTELRRRLTVESGRPAVADVRRITAEAHAGLSPLILLEERVNGLALEKGAAAKGEIAEALRPALAALAGGGPDAMRVARWAQSAAARFHQHVLDTAPARGLVMGASLLLRLRPKINSAPVNMASTISEFAWALRGVDAGTPEPLGVSLVPGGLQFAAPGAGGASIALPPTEPRLVEVEWSSPDGPEHCLVEAGPDVFLALAGSPSTVILTTLTGDQYQIGVAAGAAQDAWAGWIPPPDDLLNSSEQLFDADGQHPIGVAFAFAPELFLTARQIVEGMTTVPVAPSSPPPAAMTVLPWGLGETDEGHEDELVPLGQNGVPMEILEIAEPGVVKRYAAVIGFVDGGARWFEGVVEEEPSTWSVVRGALVKPPPLSPADLTAAFVGAPVVVDQKVIGAILSVSPPAEGQTHAVVQLTTPEYMQSVAIRARSRHQRETSGEAHATERKGEATAGGELKVFLSSTISDLIEERQVVIGAINAADHELVPSVAFKGDGPDAALTEAFAQADVVIVLIGNQYEPSVPGDPQQRSVTELEYDRAMQLGKTCLVFMREDTRNINAPLLSPKLALFVGKVRGQIPQSVRTFRTREELRDQVVEALRHAKPIQPAAEPAAPNVHAPASAPTAAGLVFVSFVRWDTKAVGSIVDALESAGIQVWRSGEVLRAVDAVDAGNALDDKVKNAINSCAVFVPLLSNIADDSPLFRSELLLAVERATKTNNRAFLTPLTLDSRKELRGKFSMLGEFTWFDGSGGVPQEFIGAVRRVIDSQASSESEATGTQSGLRWFGVPADPVPLIGRSDVLRDLTQLLKTREVSGAKVQGSKVNVISLVGPEGIGKWTVANHAAIAAADEFPDGVIWLGEDGSGYPRLMLRAYAEARGVPALFKPGSGGYDSVDQDRFREEFAPRRVLFVADQRFTSDIVPTVMMAGPDCVVLRLINSPSTSGAGHLIDVPPLTPAESGALLARVAGHMLKEPEILTFGEGRPLFLTLLGKAVRWTSERAVVDAIHSARQSTLSSLAEPQVITLIQLLAEAPERRRAMLSLMSALRKGRPFEIDLLDSAVLELLVDLGLVEIHGEFVRVHRQIESAIWSLEAATST